MNEFNGKTVLVTGAGGFIGSHLTKSLVESGAATRALVHYRSDGSRGWLEGSPHKNDIEIIAGDVRDYDSVLRSVRGCDVVFHLAALIGIPYSYHAPRSYLATNVEGTLNLLQAVREVGVSRLIHTSTSEVYGSAKYIPIDEKHPLQGQSPYSASKIAADKLAESFHLSFGLPVVTVRPFNTYGPRQSARAVIPTIITQCLGPKLVKIGNEDPTRDFNFVADTVNGFLCAGVADEAIGRTVNLGSGVEVSIRDLALKIVTLVGGDIQIENDDERVRPEASEIDHLLAANTLAKEYLDWSPSVSLEDGLRQTIAWVERNLPRYRPDDYAV